MLSLFLLTKWACLLYLVAGGMKDIRISMELVSPLKYGTIITTPDFQLSARIDILQGQLSEHQIQICMSILDLFDIYPELSHGNPVPIIDPTIHAMDNCRDRPQELLGGTGSHSFVQYVKATDGDQEYILRAVEGVFQIIFDHQSNFELSSMINVPMQYDHVDTMSLLRKEESLSLMVPTTTLLIGSEDIVSNVYRGYSPNHDASSIVNIVVFLKEIRYLGANNRLLHWLFDHARFRDHGFSLSVVTGSNNASHNLELYEKLVRSAGETIRQYDCLSSGNDISMESINQSMYLLSTYLYSSEVQVLIAVNTMGDKLTDNLLVTVETPLNADQASSDKPFVFMEIGRASCRERV